MGRKLNLSHLSQEECEQVLSVIQKDFELRQKEKERLSAIESHVKEEESKTKILTQQDEFNQNCCVRCCRTFGLIFNRKQKCLLCELNVCKSCSVYDDQSKGYVCHLCVKEKELTLQSGDWFYRNVSQKFRRFGSAKVVRSLYKRKGESQCKSDESDETVLETILASDSDSELDSGYGPFNSLQHSPTRKRPALEGVFDSAPEESELPVPSSRSPVSDKPVTRAASLETLLTSSTKDQRSQLGTKRGKDAKLGKDRSSIDTRDIYQEAFESAKRAEENKFKTKFDSLLRDLNRALEQQSPAGFSDNYDSTSYGEVMLTFRSRMKELLTGFSQRLQLAYESFDIPRQGDNITQQVRQNVSKMVEGILGESLDLTSDEAVSDLSSLSDDSAGDQNSFEDHIAQAIVSKFLENHRREISEGIDQADGRLSNRSYGGYSEDIDDDQTSDIVKDFEELRNFVKKTQSRPTPVSRDIDEVVEESPIERVTLDKSQAVEDFHIRCSSTDRVHNAEPPLPDFSEFDGIDFSSHEIDPDLLSMNLAIIPEETEEELEDEANDGPEKPWRENWIFKNMPSPYDNMGNRRVGNDEGKPLYMMVPQPEDAFVPQVGNKDADQLSDLSDSEAPRMSADDLSDDENTFYAKTSEELARISRKHSTASVQTDSDADSGIHSRILTGALRTDSGPLLGNSDSSVVMSPTDSLKSGQQPLKLTEEFVPAEGDDPTFILPPESVTVAEGEPLRISCRIGGTSAVDVFWYREHSEVEELENGEDVEVTIDGDKHGITLYNLTKAQGGQYMCIALSDQGKCTQYFIVTVTDNKQELKKPEFIKSIQDVEVKEGQSVKFRCKVKGYPQPRVIWFKDGKLLRSTKNCRIEKFGNRDYILTIDNATLDDDAEYTVAARNIAGETKSSAQVIVDSDQLDSMVSSMQSSAAIQQQKNEKNLNNLTEKVMSTRSDITSTAESMLGTAEELSYLNENLDVLDRELNKVENRIDEENNNDRLGDTSALEAVDDYRKKEKAAKNVRMLTSSALNVLRTAEEIIQSEKENHYESFLSSTPKYSSLNRTDERNNNFRDDLSTTSSDSFRYVRNVEDSTPNNVSTSNRDQDASDRRSTFKEVKEFSFGEVESDVSDIVGTKRNSVDEWDQGSSPSEIEPLRFISENNEQMMSQPAKTVNFGPKDVDAGRYSRDYDTHDTNRRKWEVKLDHFSPNAEIVNKKKDVENAEEEIYMAAGKVYSLEDRVRDLETRVSSDRGRMSDLEDEVAITVAQVHQSERQVGTIESTVLNLQDSSEASSLSPRTGSSQLSSPRLSIDSGVSSVRERPLATTMVGHTCEEEVPESRGEYDADSGIELPSVNRLRALFSRTKEDDLGDGSFTRIHSITARNVPKEQLERLRRAEFASSGRALDMIHSPPELSPSEINSSSVNFTFVNLQSPPPQQNRIVSQSLSPVPVKSPDLSYPPTYKDLEPGKDPVLIYPEPSSSSPERYDSDSAPDISTTISSTSTSTSTPKVNLRARSVTPVPQTANETVELVPRRALSPGPSQSSTDRPKTPKIRSGAISARAAFWEKRILLGSTSDEAVSEEFPEMVQEADEADC